MHAKKTCFFASPPALAIAIRHIAGCMHTLCLLAPILLKFAFPVQAQQPIDIGGRLELFVDHHLIDTMNNAKLRLHQPADRGIVMNMDGPWEGNYSGYHSVVQHDGMFYYYHRGWHRLSGHVQGGTALWAFTAVTTCRLSADGINWERPAFGLFEFDGSTDNNIIWENWSADRGGFDGYSSFFNVSINTNPDAPASEKFIALSHTQNSESGVKDLGHWAIFTSPDGVHWTMKPDFVLELQNSDAGDAVFWDPNLGQYVANLRVYYNPDTGAWGGWNLAQPRLRWVARSLSPDLTTWSTPVPFTFRDASGAPAPLEELYTFAGELYFRAPHLYIAMPDRFMADRKAVGDWYRGGVNDGVLVTSRDGITWDRTFMEAFIRPGLDPRNWTSRAKYPAKGIVQTGPEELSIYIYELIDHGPRDMRVRRMTLRLDGFASLNAGSDTGEMLTKPLVFSGNRLVLNHVTAGDGSIWVEVQDAVGNPIPGFTLADSQSLNGDNLEGIMSWTGGADVSALAGQTVRLRFVLKDADIYTLRFVSL